MSQERRKDISEGISYTYIEERKLQAMNNTKAKTTVCAEQRAGQQGSGQVSTMMNNKEGKGPAWCTTVRALEL